MSQQLVKCDRIIIGAGLYGLYAALYCAQKGNKVIVLESDDGAFKRATYINQARVHQGYHYPRSLYTAVKSAGYFERFSEDYSFCINSEFNQIYAVSTQFSWTDAEQFVSFCRAAGIPCEELNPDRFFKKGMCGGAFLTREYTYDAELLKKYFLSEIEKTGNCHILYSQRINRIEREEDHYCVFTDDRIYQSGYVLNATYASTNQILDMAGFEKFKIKYELSEIILCDAVGKLKDYGFTVMDGPFFSIMPFGKTGLHSLTSVTFTPHHSSFEELPVFECQKNSNGLCDPHRLYNCSECPGCPHTAYNYMSAFARKYLREEYSFEYRESLFSMKPILKSSEIDDSRPTVIKICSESPYFISVLSGKINTVYDLDEVLDYEC